MTHGPANVSPAPPKPLRVGLVAGDRTLANLGPVVRHLVVGLLDEPMHVSLVCPAAAEAGHIPDPPVEMIRYGSLRLPWLGARSVEALAERLGLSGVSVLHGLDADALAGAMDRELARLNVEYESKRRSGRLGSICPMLLEQGAFEQAESENIRRRRGRSEQYKHQYLLTDVLDESANVVRSEHG